MSFIRSSKIRMQSPHSIALISPTSLNYIPAEPKEGPKPIISSHLLVASRVVHPLLILLVKGSSIPWIHLQPMWHRPSIVPHVLITLPVALRDRAIPVDVGKRLRLRQSGKRRAKIGGGLVE